MRSALRRRVAAAVVPAFAALLLPAQALAVEVQDVGGKPMLIDITNTSIVNYHFDNRNDGLFDIPNKVDDNYGEWLDRFNIHVNWWRFRLEVRVDSNVYFNTMNRASVAAMVADEKNLTTQYKKDPNEYTNEFYEQLHSRYLRAMYPSKFLAGYSQPGVDVTVGDFYAQLGRGLVFSVRKVDELAVDTTVRGGKIVADHEFGDIHVGGTFFGGQMNPLRVDEATGRRLNGTHDALFFDFPTGGDLETYQPEPGSVLTVIDRARPSYLEDSVFGGHAEAGSREVMFGANASLLLRKNNTSNYLACQRAGQDVTLTGSTRIEGNCTSQFPEITSNNPSQMHNQIATFSGSVNVPSILKHGDLYVEAAGQTLRDGHLLYDTAYDSIGKWPDLSGYALYGSASASGGPVSVSVEAKHYRSFFPLAANIDSTTPGFGAPEFAIIQYSSPPTAEPVYTEVVSGGSPTVCITGGRARADYRFNRSTSLYAWVGRYTSWSEHPAHLNPTCIISPIYQTNTWDTAAGMDMGLDKGRSHVRAWIGARESDNAVAQETQGGVSTSFYREGYLRYDIVAHLVGPFSLQFQGFHRRRYEPVNYAAPWNEGENYTALQWSPHVSAVMGYEYFVQELCQPYRPASVSRPARDSSNVCSYVNGGLQWRSHGAGTGVAKVFGQIFDTVSTFVGQRRAAIRCVSGVCRQFPAFEGAKLEITSRF